MLSRSFEFRFSFHFFLCEIIFFSHLLFIDREFFFPSNPHFVYNYVEISFICDICLKISCTFLKQFDYFGNPRFWNSYQCFSLIYKNHVVFLFHLILLTFIRVNKSIFVFRRKNIYFFQSQIFKNLFFYATNFEYLKLVVGSRTCAFTRLSESNCEI